MDSVIEELSEINILEASVEAKAKVDQMLKDIMKKCLSPPPKLNLVDWANEYRYLPDNSAEAGRWKTDRVEVSREPMLSVSSPEIQEVTIMSCIQLMKTELMLNTALYYMHQEPSPIMYIAPKKEIAEAWSKERLVKSVNATPVVADIFSGNRRGEGNTITQKQYKGGQISIVSARNPDDLAMRACRILLFDECDKYEKNVGGTATGGGEGDPIAIAWGRATTYGKRAKKITACSPTVQGKSRIEEEYNNSDMRVFYQPCPHCNHAKVLNWTDVHIPKNEKGNFVHEKAEIICVGCGAAWNESDRKKSIRKGYWVATKPEVTWHHGYKVSSIASPFTSIIMLAKEFVDAQDNPERLKAFYNTRMAETWKEVGEQPDWSRMYERREDYETCIVPDGALLLTCGIDMGGKGLHYEVVAWGRKKISWSIDKGFINGRIEDDDTAEELTQFLDRTYKNSKGIEVPLMKTCIDSSWNTQSAYAFCRSYGSSSVVPIKGDKEGGLKTAIGTPTHVDVMINGKRASRGLMMWMVGVSVIKEQVYRWFNAKKPSDEQLEQGREYPTGYCHFPMWDEEFFKQLTAEQYLRLTDARGFHKYVWEKLRKDNHYLDCRVYARAASVMLQIDRMTDEDWLSLEKTYFVAETPVIDDKATEVRSSGGRRKGNWMN